MLDTIDYGVLFMGPDSRTKIINRAFRQMWGISGRIHSRHAPNDGRAHKLQSPQQSL